MIVLQILVIALLFTIVVGVHELGHFLFARWRGMEVEEFAVGFGKKVFCTKCSKGTEYCLRAIPLGGFVRIKGMEPKPDGSETSISRGFYSRGLGSRALVLFAGPLFSILFGYVFFFGEIAAFGRKDAPVIGEVSGGSAADKAGLRAGDKIVAVDAKPIERFTEIRGLVQESKGKELSLTVERASRRLQVPVSPTYEKVQIPQEFKDDPGVKDLPAKQFQLGVKPAPSVPVGLGEAAAVALDNTKMIVTETAKVLTNPARLKKEAGGIISIGKAAGQAVEYGVPYFISIAALISVSLGLINLLPIPLMDGGQLMVVLVEALRGGRRLSLRTQEVLGVVGIVMIGILFISVTYLDIGRLLD
ncbi:MAG: RIP metalloprotease [Armatimonadetes bacterium]|nr:RIP metalloprotease [Armatimonadota bacterium]